MGSCSRYFWLPKGRRLWVVFAVSLLTLAALGMMGILPHEALFFIQKDATAFHKESSIDSRSLQMRDTNQVNAVISHRPEPADEPSADEKAADEAATDEAAANKAHSSLQSGVRLASQGEADSTECLLNLCNKGLCFENLICHKPFKYLTNFKNPCFYEQIKEDDSDQSVYKNLIILRMLGGKSNQQVDRFHQQWQKRRKGKEKQLRCLPYFFIIGMEKSGTTDLYQRINAHPDIVLSPAKELQWWTRRRFFVKHNGTYPGSLQTDYYKMTHMESLVNVPFSHYYAFFDQVADNMEKTYIRTKQGEYHYKITGDGSPNNMFWNDFAEIYAPIPKDGPTQIIAHHIAAVLPQARIISILRDPVDRLYSSYLFFNRGVTSDTFHLAVQKAIKLSNQCIKEHSLRFCVYDWRLKEEVGSTINLMQGVYSVMISDWLKVFNSSQLHVIHFESYKESELTELNKAFRFLDVQGVEEDTSEGRAILKKATSLKGSQYNRVGEMRKKTRAILKQFYEPYNLQLAELVGNDKFKWDS